MLCSHASLKHVWFSELRTQNNPFKQNTRAVCNSNQGCQSRTSKVLQILNYNKSFFQMAALFQFYSNNSTESLNNNKIYKQMTVFINFQVLTWVALIASLEAADGLYEI